MNEEGIAYTDVQRGLELGCDEETEYSMAGYKHTEKL